MPSLKGPHTHRGQTAGTDILKTHHWVSDAIHVEQDDLICLTIVMKLSSY